MSHKDTISYTVLLATSVSSDTILRARIRNKTRSLTTRIANSLGLYEHGSVTRNGTLGDFQGKIYYAFQHCIRDESSEVLAQVYADFLESLEVNCTIIGDGSLRIEYEEFCSYLDAAIDRTMLM